MPAQDKPAAEVDVTVGLVRALLADQHPDLADRPLAELAAGWDNVLFRLGDDLIVRLPRREMGAGLVAHEQRWLPELAPHLPVPVPAPVRIGRPALGYPWSWSVCPWIDGAAPGRVAPFDPDGLAEDLGSFVRALHRPAPADAPVNPYRGGPLTDRTAAVTERAARLHDLIDAPAVLARWAELVATPPWSGPPMWLHGDLHPGNLLVRDGRLAAVLDFGDLTAGDPATDLAIAWILLPPGSRPRLRAGAGGVDDDTWRRAKGWALSLGLAYLLGSAGDEALAADGHRALDAVLGDPD